MNNKSKLVLGLSAMLAATVGVAATGTFAWFTSTRVATVNFTSATVYNKAANLLISYADVDDSASGSGTDVSTIAVSGSSGQITDISGNGHAFFKPTWLPGYEGTRASAIGAATNSTDGSNATYFVTFNIVAKNTGNVSMNLYLDAGTALKAHDGSALSADTLKTSADVASVYATRMAIFNGTTMLTYFEQVQDPVTGKASTYLAAKTGGTAYSSDGGTTASDYELTTITADATGSKAHVGAFQTVSKSVANWQEGQSLGTIAANGSLTLSISLWIEGTATTCKSSDTMDSATPANVVYKSAVGGKVDADIKLAALEA